ncbi:MAG: hypothetical protein OXI26_07485 [bacterium]|nr:hypothetical protein [bacterium]
MTDTGFDATITANVLANYVPHLRRGAHSGDDVWCQRLLINDFGMVFRDAPSPEARRVLLAEEPDVIDARWDAFVGAYGEFLAHAADIPPPDWVYNPRRRLDELWIPGPTFEAEHEWRIATSPPQFAARNVAFPADHLLVDGVAVVLSPEEINRPPARRRR